MHEELELLLEEYGVDLPEYLERSIDALLLSNDIDWDIHYCELQADISTAQVDGDIPVQLAYDLREMFL